MHFQDAYELIRVFGPRATARTLSKVTGISARTLARLATERGITLRTTIEPISGMEHLPGLPNFTESRAWRGGTIYRIDLSKAGDSPGYRSLLIHQSGVQGQDEEDDKDDQSLLRDRSGDPLRDAAPAVGHRPSPGTHGAR